MYTKEDILKNLNADNYFIDRKALDSFIRNWGIDAIYEDEEGVEFFDAISISKIKKGISLKSQGYPNDQIVHRITKIASELLPPAVVEPTRVNTMPPQSGFSTNNVQNAGQSSELQNVTIDVTGQTLQMLAEAVAQKITVDIKDEIAHQLIKTGSYKRDNEILSKQVKELLDDNRKMAIRLAAIENEKKSFWRRVFNI